MFRYDEENKRIYITRGDTATITVTIQDSSGTDYELEDGDKIVFSVRKKTSDADAIFRIESENGIFFISHDDTSIDVGQYSCDIEIVHANGNYDTVFPNFENDRYLRFNQNWRNFWVTPEVSTDV